MANFKEKKYTVDDIAKIRKGMEEADVRRKEEIAKQTNTAPIYGNKIPTLEQVSKTKIAQGKDNASLSIKAQEAKNADRAREAAVKKATRETRKQVNNIAKNVGDTNINRYNSRFSIDKPIQNISADDLRAMQENRLKSEKNNVNNTSNQKSLDYYTKKDLEEERANIRAKGQGMSTLETNRLKEINKQLEADNRLNETKTNKRTDNYLVSRDRYDKLMQDGRFKNDMENLTSLIYADSIGGGNEEANIDLQSKRLFGVNKEQAIETLSRRYGLTRRELYDVATTMNSDRQRAEEEQYRNDLYDLTARKADDNKIEGAAKDVLATLGSYTGTLGNTVEGAYNNLVGLATGDDRYMSNMFSTTKEGLREGVANNYDTNLGKTAYNLVAGLGDLGAGALMGNPALTFAGNTASLAQREALENGSDVRSASLYGIGSGITDYITNKIGLDKAKAMATNSIKSTGIKNFLAQNAIAGLGEGGENLIQDVAQTVLDNIINGENSEARTTYNDLIANGSSEDEAFAEVAKQMGSQIILDTLQGVGMGSLMQAGTTFKNSGGIKNLGRNVSDFINYKALRSKSEDIDNNVNNYFNNKSQIPAVEKVEAEPMTNEIPTVERPIAETISNEPIANAPETRNIANDIAERYASVSNDFDTYDYMDNVEMSDSIVAQMADDIETGKDLTGYIDALIENVDDAPDTEIRAQMEGLINELETLNRGRVAENTEAISNVVEKKPTTNRVMAENIGLEGKGNTSDTNYDIARSQIDDMKADEPIFDNNIDKRAYDTAMENFELAYEDWAKEPTSRNEQDLMNAYDNLKATSKEGYFVDDSARDIYRQIKKDFAGKTNGYVINLPDNILAEMPDMNVRQLNSIMSTLGKGHIVFRRGKGTPIDEIWDELVDASGNNLDRNIANEGDMAVALRDFVDGLGDDVRSFSGEKVPFNVNNYLTEDFWDGVFETTANYATQLENTGIRNTNSITEEIPNEQNTYTIESEPVERNPYKEKGLSQFGTNTLINSAVTSREEIESKPIVKELLGVESTSNSETVNAALDRMNDSEKWFNAYTNGEQKIETATDIDTTLLLLKDYADTMELGADENIRAEAEAKRNLLMGKAVEATHRGGQFLQALVKWNNLTPEGAMLNAERLASQEIKKIYGDGTDEKTNRNAKTRESKEIDDLSKNLVDELNPKTKEKKGQLPISRKLDTAIKDLSKVKSLNKEGKEKTHEQKLEEVRNTLKKHKIEADDETVEILANYVENIPTWQLTEQMRNFAQTGKFFTVDESTPIKKNKSSKLTSILNDIENIRKTNTVDETGYPKKSYSDIVEEVTNTVNDSEMASLNLTSDTDIEHISTLLDSGIARWQIEDELQYRLDTGKWHSLSEVTQAKDHYNQKLANVFRELTKTDEGVAEKPVKSLEDIKAEVQRTFTDKANNIRRNGDFNDDDYKYVANLISSGVSSEDLSNAIKRRLVTGKWGISSEAMESVSKYIEYAQTLDKDSKERVMTEMKAYQILADEIYGKDSASLKDKFNAWRYLAMLGNPKTHVRNIVGNTLFQGVTGISNNVAAALEELADKHSIKKTGKGIDRTKAILNLSNESDRNLINASGKDSDKTYGRWSGNKWNEDLRTNIERQRRIFKNSAVNAANEINSKLLDAEDNMAMRSKYKTSLAGFLKGNGEDASIFDVEDRIKTLENAKKGNPLDESINNELRTLKQRRDLLERAREYAIKQAKYSAFHEDNAIADSISKFSNDLKKKGDEGSKGARFVHYILEGLLPFKKTPANILKSGIEYSPLNFFFNDVSKLSKYKKGTDNIELSDVFESMSKTLTGSIITALGALLYNNGILQSSTNDEYYQDQLEGKQNYSLRFGDYTATIDFAAPSVMPLLLGAELAKVWQSNGKDMSELYTALQDKDSDKAMAAAGDLTKAVGLAATNIASPLVETSMLQGLNDSIENVGKALAYGGNAGNALSSMATNTLTSYFTSGIPTLAGQLARTIDNTRRSTYSDSVLGNGKQIEKLQNKIPFLSMKNEPYVDAHGDTQTNAPTDNFIGRLLYQTLSPSYIDKIEQTEGDKFAREVYNETKNPDVFSDWKSTKKIDGKNVSPEDYTKYTTVKGKADTEIRNYLAKDSWFNSLTRTQQGEILKKLANLEDKIGEAAINPNFDGSTKEYVAYTNGLDSLRDYYKETVLKNQTKSIAGDLSTSSNAFKELQADVDSGNVKAAEEKADAFTQLKQMGGSQGMVNGWTNASKAIPELTPTTYYNQYNEIDSIEEKSGKISLAELEKYINRGNRTEEEAQALWNAYYGGWTNKAGQKRKIKKENGVYVSFY